MNLLPRRGLALLAVTCLLPFALNTKAQVIEGFEPGDPAVSTAGDAGIKGTYLDIAPPQGVSQFLITTINTGGTDGVDGYANQNGTNAIGNIALQTFFNGVDPTGVQTEGSGFKLTFTVNPGDTFLTFDYNFLTNEDQAVFHHNDIAYAMLFDASNVLQGGIQTITTVNTGSFSLMSNQDLFAFETGYQTFNMSLVGLAPGTYTLGIGIQDATTDDIPSALLVDNIQIIVPEPSTVGLGIAGAVLLIALRSRFRKA